MTLEQELQEENERLQEENERLLQQVGQLQVQLTTMTAREQAVKPLLQTIRQQEQEIMSLNSSLIEERRQNGKLLELTKIHQELNNIQSSLENIATSIKEAASSDIWCKEDSYDETEATKPIVSVMEKKSTVILFCIMLVSFVAALAYVVMEPEYESVKYHPRVDRSIIDTQRSK